MARGVRHGWSRVANSYRPNALTRRVLGRSEPGVMTASALRIRFRRAVSFAVEAKSIQPKVLWAVSTWSLNRLRDERSWSAEGRVTHTPRFP